MYRLGDFIQHGVCNERGMLLQVCLQYVGIESKMEKGQVPGGLHAWVRAFPKDPNPRSTEVILDPQQQKPIYVQMNPAKAAEFQVDHAIPFAGQQVSTSWLPRLRNALVSSLPWTQKIP